VIVGENFALGTDHEAGTGAFFRIYAEKAASIHRGCDKYGGIAGRFVDVDIVLLIAGKTRRRRRCGFAPHAADPAHGAQDAADVPTRDTGEVDKTGSQQDCPEKTSQHSHD